MSTKHLIIVFTFLVTSLSVNTFAQNEKQIESTKEAVKSDKKLDLSFNGKKPLVIVDGQEKDSNYLSNKLSPDDIASVVVLKGENAFKKYGEKGKQGVVEIVTKAAEKIKKDTSTKVKIKSSSEEPITDYKILYIVDGEVVEESQIEQIHTDLIEKIDVIKDPKEIALFTDQAFDGMVKIKLKK